MALIAPKYCFLCDDSPLHIDGYCGGCELRAKRALRKNKKQKARVLKVKRKSGVTLPRAYN